MPNQVPHEQGQELALELDQEHDLDLIREADSTLEQGKIQGQEISIILILFSKTKTLLTLHQKFMSKPHTNSIVMLTSAVSEESTKF